MQIRILKDSKEIAKTIIDNNLYHSTGWMIYIRCNEVLQNEPLIVINHAVIIYVDGVAVSVGLHSKFDDLVMFYTKPEYRRKGYGTVVAKMMHEAFPDVPAEPSTKEAAGTLMRVGITCHGWVDHFWYMAKSFQTFDFEIKMGEHAYGIPADMTTTINKRRHVLLRDKIEYTEFVMGRRHIFYIGKNVDDFKHALSYGMTYLRKENGKQLHY